MSPPKDWLSRLLEIMTVTGQLDVRCAYGSPWRIVYEQSKLGEIPYHVVLNGSAILEGPSSTSPIALRAGDIVLLPHGSAHMLHDGSGRLAAPARVRNDVNVTVSENDGLGERLDMLCGHFFITPPHDRLARDFLPTALIVSAAASEPGGGTRAGLTSLMELMRGESLGNRLGGHAMLNALSTMLFALTMRLASESDQPPTGLLGLAGHPRLAPAISAIFNQPASPWTVPELAQRCNMSRATFMRQFQQSFGRTAHDLLLAVRMSLAANALKNPVTKTEVVAETVGYQSVAAFRRAFTEQLGMTPAQWRRTVGTLSHPDEQAEEAVSLLGESVPAGNEPTE
ncbi:cupin domain-containing protein [Cupriavidus sp. CP313]